MADVNVVVFGPGAVGKSALTIQFVHGYFVEDYDPTIEDQYKKSIVVDGKTVQLNILDTAGQGEFVSMRVSYIRQSKGFIIVYAIDNRSSFNEVESFHSEIVETRGKQNIPLVLLGNKCDLDQRREVSKNEGEEMAKQIGAVFLETSAFMNINVESAFVTIVREIWKTETPASDNAGTRTKAKSGGFRCLLL
uniref:small monomeric GTPase n=1 Tax=Coptotermes formosanus TaxID=36987 RepID=L0AV13_COPFO|nr:small GTP-binding protein [Coptotermes formosanus]